MHQTTDRAVCIVCSDEVDLNDAHWVHQRECPQTRGEDRCTCHNVAHADCCPTCHPPAPAPEADG